MLNINFPKAKKLDYFLGEIDITSPSLTVIDVKSAKFRERPLKDTLTSEGLNLAEDMTSAIGMELGIMTQTPLMEIEISDID